MARMRIPPNQDEKQTLKKLAGEAGKSKPAYVGNLIRRAALRSAANRMADEYRHDPDLTCFSMLDQDDFLNNPEVI